MRMHTPAICVMQTMQPVHTFAGENCVLLMTRQFVKVALEFISAYTAPPPVAPARLPLDTMVRVRTCGSSCNSDLRT